jgi:hypothetical protein
LRRWLADQHLSYVLAISSRHRCGPRGQSARTISAILPEHAWQTRSAGDGTHGLRAYAWALVPLPGKRDDGFEDAPLLRRSLTDGERAYYPVHAPADTPLPETVRTAGARWAKAGHILHWSRWRRRHQHRARLSHYRRRGHQPP